MSEVTLTEEQKQQIEELFKSNPDLRDITQKVFDDETLDGRSKQGRAVRAFLIKSDLTYKTTLVDKAEEIDLTTEQKQFLMSNNIERGMNALEVARLTFKDREIQPLSQQHRVTMEFLRKYRPEIVDDNEMLTNDKWSPPKSLSRAIKKVNDWAGQNFDEITIQTKHKKMCEKLLLYLKSPRFTHFINQYSTVADRELFESSFVRYTWDKDDLTQEEVDQYIVLSAEVVIASNIQRRVERLQTLLDQNAEDTEGRKMAMSLVEAINTAQTEYNQCVNRQTKLLNELKEKRSQRMSKMMQDSASILNLVELWKDEESRNKMIKLADLRRQNVSSEIERLSSMEEIKSRILGISEEEVLNG